MSHTHQGTQPSPPPSALRELMEERSWTQEAPPTPLGQRAYYATDRTGCGYVIEIFDADPPLMRRGQTLTQLRHPGMACVYGQRCLGDGNLAVWREYVEGAELLTLVRARGSMSHGEIRRLISDIGGALALLHEHDLAHGDISARNVIITPAGSAVLIDLVDSGCHLGTEPWAAPERLAGSGASSASDVYSLGALARSCMAATGQRVVDGADEEWLNVLAGAVSPQACDRPLLSELLAHGDPSVPISWRGSKGHDGKESGGGDEAENIDESQIATLMRPPSRGRRMAPITLVSGLIVACAVTALTNTHTVRQMGAHLPHEATQFTSSPSTQSRQRSAPALETSSHRQSERDAVEDGIRQAVSTLIRARDAAVISADEQALAALTVPGSPAAEADAAMAARLRQSGDRIVGLRTSLIDVELINDSELIARYADMGATSAVIVKRQQEEYVRISSQGQRRVVPALPVQESLWVLAPQPWRVVDILHTP